MCSTPQAASGCPGTHRPAWDPHGGRCQIDPGIPGPAAYLAAIPPALLADAGVHGTCPADCYVTVIAVGNIDDDADLDVWSISTQARTLGGEAVPAGQPFHHVNDLK